MKQNESSITSLMTSFGRAYHSRFDNPKIFNDDIAEQLITKQEFDNISENLIQGSQFFIDTIPSKILDQPKEILRWITQVQLSPISLSRSAFCEKVLHNEIMLGAVQYVILGAGLDTFGYRHPEFNPRLQIFEIDHPSTQAVKVDRLKLADLDLPNNLHFVAMDFTHEFSPQQLYIAGFENKKTFFSLLGVSYYLTKIETINLLKHIFAIVPKGSSIVFDFADENVFVEKGKHNRVANMLKMAATVGEPMKSGFSYDELEQLLEECGLLIYEHLTPAQINEQFFKNRTDYLTAFETVHYIHAVKQ
ncbi:class I SAM-dependent methyltransferase [Bacillus marasmi]|uniref:class I SAM-dependent methyltransferase n=1 Tax=Bacillus marasmi TaxID=1926279 RepID=UPI0011C8F0EC|nr:class I SAM-dependent methyltransferase [Bacillus marasmi]